MAQHTKHIDTVILGANDPEMMAIEHLARAAGLIVLHAAAGGQRVVGGTATVYHAHSTVPATPADADALRAFSSAMFEADCESRGHAGVARLDAVAVECGGDFEVPLVYGENISVDVIATCDHHRPGDFGYGRPPAAAVAASSLGQFIALLANCGRLPPTWPEVFWCEEGELPADAANGVYRGSAPHRVVYHQTAQCWVVGRPDDAFYRQIPTDLVLIAACDHALAAAYAGGVPGVSTDAVVLHRRAQKAEWLRGLPWGHPERVGVAAAFGLDEATVAGEDDSARSWHNPHHYNGWDGAVRGAIEAARRTVEGAPTFMLGGVAVRDLRGEPVPLLPDALCELGECAVYCAPGTAQDPRTKIGIIGGGEGTVPGWAPVQEFYRQAREGVLLGIRVDNMSAYGNPVRGYAGVYQVE